MSAEFGPLVLDCINEIYKRTDFESRYMLTLVSHGWRQYCLNHWASISDVSLISRKVIMFVMGYIKIIERGDILDAILYNTYTSELFNERALACAATYGHKLLTKIILNKLPILEGTCLKEMTAAKDPEIIKMVVTRCKHRNYGFVEACSAGNAEFVKTIVELGGGGKRKPKGLIEACFNGHLNIIDILMPNYKLPYQCVDALFIPRSNRDNWYIIRKTLPFVEILQSQYLRCIYIAIRSEIVDVVVLLIERLLKSGVKIAQRIRIMHDIFEYGRRYDLAILKSITMSVLTRQPGFKGWSSQKEKILDVHFIR